MRRTRRLVPVSEWTDPRHTRGLAGERIALAYLVSCGWEIEAHRFRVGRHEIDLVARRDELVVFVEVKTRRSEACGAAVEAVSRLKRRTIARVAAVWLLGYGRPGDTYRFDMIAVRDQGGGRYAVEHVEDAWRIVR